MKLKDGLYFEKAPSYCENQHRMFIVDNGKIGDAGIIHIAFHKSPECVRKIKKHLGMKTKNSFGWTKINKMFNTMGLM